MWIGVRLLSLGGFLDTQLMYLMRVHAAQV